MERKSTATDPQGAPPRTPKNTRVYAIGDVHGRRDLLDRLLESVVEDAAHAPKRKVLVLLGDYIDRGPDSAGVLDRVAALTNGERLKGFEIVALKGNHEDLMLQFLAGLDDRGLWLANGGRDCVKSYGLDPRKSPAKLREALLKALPKTHRRVLRDLKTAHEEGDFGFAHAGVRPGVAWKSQSATDLVWIRRTFLDSDDHFGRFVIHGHSPTDAPDVRANRIGVDTRAWASGVLTCVVLEGEKRRFLST